MPSVCLYFQVHQPYRLRPVQIFDIAARPDYFDDAMNREMCRKVARKCYLPANRLMLKLIKRYPGKFKVAYSISGVTLEQLAAEAPEVIKSFQDLVATGQVEMLAETSHHSLASIFSPDEFAEQVAIQLRTLRRLFGVRPTVFRNTELIYSDKIASQVAALGFKAMLMEGWEPVLNSRSPDHVYTAAGTPKVKLLPKNYRLSDDIAFRFSNHDWKEWPLTAATFASWLQAAKDAETINLFMDYETIGEHQWEETGIFRFFEELPKAVLANPAFSFATPSEAIAEHPVRGTLKVPKPLSWADTERDLSAWLGNPMQDGIAEWVYRLEKRVKALGDRALLETWRRLQISDHFYYMCTKHWADGDVHRYFSVYKTPHEAYVYMNNALTDFEMRLEDKEARKKKAASRTRRQTKRD